MFIKQLFAAVQFKNDRYKNVVVRRIIESRESVKVRHTRSTK